MPLVTGYPTVAYIVSQAARQLGLSLVDIADPFVSTDPNILQMTSLLEGLGQDLVRQYRWTALEVSYNFVTTPAQQAYPLPVQAARSIDQSQWNRTRQLPVPSGVSPQQWEQLQARSASGVIYKVARFFAGTINIFPVPTTAELIALEYVSLLWLATSATSPLVGVKDAPTLASDICILDHMMMISGLKLAFRREKGFDTTAEQRAFDLALAAARGGDGDAPVLDLTPARGEPMIGSANLPETGYGS